MEITLQLFFIFGWEKNVQHFEPTIERSEHERTCGNKNVEISSKNGLRFTLEILMYSDVMYDNKDTHAQQTQNVKSMLV